MAFVTVGNRTLNPAIDDRAVFPPVRTNEETGYLFQLESLSPETLTDDTYFLVIPVIKGRQGDVELPLDSKFFPKGRRFLFSVGVPKADSFNGRRLQIEVYPKRRFKRSANNQPVTLRLYFEDDSELEAKSVEV